MNAHALAALTCLCLVISSAVKAEEAAGDWIGRIPSGFEVRLHVDKSPAGYSAVLINASGNRNPLDHVSSDGARLRFRNGDASLSYDGAWNEQSKTWEGALALQGSHSLNLRRMTADELTPVVVRRPQEDAIKAGPRPYVDREVVFDNPSAGISLAGVLSVPSGSGPFPVAVLISGTGMNTRDQDVSGHKTFRVLAVALARKGIAVLRYDKRGVGKSKGDYASATTADFASDAAAAVAFLKSHPQIDRRRIGLVGYSEGGVIAPMVAAKDSDIAFVVMIAGPGVRGDKLITLQRVATSRLLGVPEAYIGKRKAFDEQVYGAIRSAPSPEQARARVASLAAQGLAENVLEPGEAKGLPAGLTRPWDLFFQANDPATALRKVRAPVLALNGSLDVQVTARENLAAIRQALRQNKDATVEEMPGMNHLLQTAKTGLPGEYGQIENAMDPTALKLIADWVSEHTSTASRSARNQAFPLIP